MPVLDENPAGNLLDNQVLDKLKYLLSNEGETREHKDIPKGQIVINRSRLREECLDLFEGTSNTKNKAFGRVMEKLIATNQVLYTGSARSNQWLWLKNENKQQDNQF